MAAKMVDRLEQQGRLDTVTPGNIAYYTLPASQEWPPRQRFEPR